jgi:NAD(P)-dependent dehydrogenase (short-subunit alcohol dehydrogenase family)
MNRPSEEPVDRPLSLEGKVAVVTGAGQGIGRRVAERFAAAGARVFAGDLDEGRAGTAASELSDELGREVVGLGVDVSSEDSVSELARSATERSGRLDIWANFAATGYPTDPKDFFEAADYPLEMWNRVLSVNLTGSFLCSRAAAREMIKAGNGGVILLTSTTVVDRYPGHRGMVGYAASKGGIEQLTMVMAAELGPHDIRVLALKPTVVETEGMREHMDAVARVIDSDEAFGELEKMMPLGRFGVPDDIARVAQFAVSDLASFMTGVVIPVDGGESLI